MVDKAQYELFLENMDQSFIKSEPELIIDKSNVNEHLISNVNEFSDYYNDNDNNLNAFYLVNEEIVYTEPDYDDIVDVVCDTSSSSTSAVPLISTVAASSSSSSSSSITTTTRRDAHRHSIDELFCDVNEKDKNEAAQFLTADALGGLNLDDNEQILLCSSPLTPPPLYNSNNLECQELKLKCFECNSSFKNQSSLTKHNRSVHYYNKPTENGIDEHHQHMVSGTRDESHSTQKSYSCKSCPLRFAREKALISHERMHENSRDALSDFQCKHCGKKFSRHRSLERHSVKCLNGGGGQQRVKKRPSANGVGNCTNRPNELDTIQSATTTTTTTKTQSTNQKANIHPCPQCSKMFATKQKVFRHMWIHRKKAFSCEVCATSFSEQHELDEHRLSRHAEESPYVCLECGKCFASRQGLWEHNRIHTTNPNSLFTCNTCTKTFSSRQGFMIHNRTHTGEKPFKCSFCHKSFRDGGTLRKHQRIHTGERPHKCPLCAKGFNQKVVLREHIRWVHVSNKIEYPDPSPYYCSLCSIAHSDREELCMHMVKHSDQIVAFNKENSKLRQTVDSHNDDDDDDVDDDDVGDDGIDESTTENAGTNNMKIPNGAKCIQNVIQRNRLILEKYKALLCKPLPRDSQSAQSYLCQMCNVSFNKNELFLEHIKMHI